MANPPPSQEAALEEKHLVFLAQQGDLAAFGELCRRHTQLLLRQAMVVSGKAELAEDLAQETFIETWRTIKRFRGGCRFLTWLCAIMLRRHRNSQRRRAWRGFLMWDDAHHETVELDPNGDAENTVPPDVAAERADRDIRLQQALAALPHKQRVVIHLRFYSDETLEGIALALGISQGTVKSRLFHGLERLRRMKTIQESAETTKGTHDH